MLFSKTNSRQAFTLIELLVVIAIIGLLASIALVALNGARAKSRDAKRLSDTRQILTALNLYYAKYGKYPGPVTAWGEGGLECGGWDTTTIDQDGDGRYWLEPLEDEGLIAPVPVDPLNTGGCGGKIYKYHRYGAGYSDCDVNRGAFFVLEIMDMETSGRPHSQSPGWSCPSRNWQNEADWVTGAFEN